MNIVHSILIIVVIALVTFALRFIPFLIFSDRQTPEFIVYLGNVLPYSIMAMLVVFCLKNISFISKPYGLPEIISCGVVSLLYVLKRSTILSVIAGTLCYMFLVQMVF